MSDFRTVLRAEPASERVHLCPRTYCSVVTGCAVCRWPSTIVSCLFTLVSQVWLRSWLQFSDLGNLCGCSGLSVFIAALITPGGGAWGESSNEMVSTGPLPPCHFVLSLSLLSEVFLLFHCSCSLIESRLYFDCSSFCYVSVPLSSLEEIICNQFPSLVSRNSTS